MLQRNGNMDSSELLEKISSIKQAANFVTDLSPIPQKFNIIVDGQNIGFEIFYDPLLLCWKCNLTDAIGDDILTDATLMAGQNICQGLHLKYRSMNFQGYIIEHEFAIKGLFVTEPLDWKFNDYERGVESTKYAFTANNIGNCPCAILYFTDLDISNLYVELINGENITPQIGIQDLDYTIEVK